MLTDLVNWRRMRRLKKEFSILVSNSNSRILYNIVMMKMLKMTKMMIIIQYKQHREEIQIIILEANILRQYFSKGFQILMKSIIVITL